MSQNKKKVQCEKCKEYFFCDEHHILPKAIFGNGEVHNLCKNCHDEFHRALGHKYLRQDNKQPMKFYLLKYYRWLAGLAVIAGILFFLLKIK